MDTPKTEIITPAEAQFWQEQANKAPAILRERADQVKLDNISRPGNFARVAGVTFGGLLAAATATKWVKGNWKWATGAAALASAVGGFAMGSASDKSINVALRVAATEKQMAVEFANVLQGDAPLRTQLADYLSSHITGAQLQEKQLDEAVLQATCDFGRTTKYLSDERIRAIVDGQQGRGR